MTEDKNSNENHYQKTIDEAINQTDPHINIGVKIRDLSSDKIIYERNSGRHFIFASAKKFIALTALQRFFNYNNYSFSSRILQKENDHYLDISAPFYSDHLDMLLNLMKRKVANAFVQNFYIVNSIFTSMNYGWQNGRRH